MSDVVIGRNAVREALRVGRKVERILVAAGVKERGAVDEILHLAEERHIPVAFVERRHLEKYGEVHQGVVALVEPFRYSSLEEMVDLAIQRSEPLLLVMLDSVTDPQNLGALIRTADAAGAHGVVVPKHRAVGVTAAAEKASAGAVEYVRIAQVTNLVRAIEEMKKLGAWSVGLDASATSEIYDLDYTAPTAFVLGSEGSGLSRLVKESCDFLTRIPMKGRVGSLNVSVAGAVALYEAMRQRGRGQGSGDGGTDPLKLDY